MANPPRGNVTRINPKKDVIVVAHRSQGDVQLLQQVAKKPNNATIRVAQTEVVHLKGAGQVTNGRVGEVWVDGGGAETTYLE